MHSRDEGSETICRVCGHTDGSLRWEEYDGKLYPNYLICDCCGSESGYHDMILEGIQKNRSSWIDAGAKWRYPKYKPDNWNLEEQLSRIPSKYR